MSDARRPSQPDVPCKCLQSHAFVSPVHEGHCCFLPENQACHEEEFLRWQAEEVRIVTGEKGST